MPGSPGSSEEQGSSLYQVPGDRKSSHREVSRAFTVWCRQEAKRKGKGMRLGK